MSELTMHQFVNRLEIHKDDVDDVFKLMFQGEEFGIFNPYLSTCGRFRVDPKTYGLTLEQASLLRMVNESLEDADEKVDRTVKQCLDYTHDRVLVNRSFWTLDSLDQSKGVEGLNLIGYAMAAFALDSLAKQYA